MNRIHYVHSRFYHIYAFPAIGVQRLFRKGILFTIPVSPHARPRYHELTSLVTTIVASPSRPPSPCIIENKSSIKSAATAIRMQKVFSENHPFIARYCRIPYSDIAEVIHDHAQRISTSAIATLLVTPNSYPLISVPSRTTIVSPLSTSTVT